MGDTSAYLDIPVPVLPTCATIWPKAGRGEWEAVEDLSVSASLERLRVAKADGATVWIETQLEIDDQLQSEWLEGEYKVWGALPTPRIYWNLVQEALTAIGLHAPAPHRVDGELGSTRLLRALPFAYSRGAFGTVRDALFEPRVVAELQKDAGGCPLTAFPTAGFRPEKSGLSDGAELAYTVLRATVGVFGNAIVSVRLPDTFCSDRAGTAKRVSQRKLVPADVLTRFLPQGRTASGREVAEAIGMHQATSARAVAAVIRDQLQDIERLAWLLNDGIELHDDIRPRLKGDVTEKASVIDGLADVAHQLDRHLSTILRRFSGEISGAPAVVQELVPAEAKRRYGFALDNVHALHDDCRLASQTVRHELMAYEHAQRDHFQFIAAVLASVVLIPTLIASVLGVNLGVPGEHSRAGFVAFVLAIGGLSVVGYSALRTADEHNWSPPRDQVRAQIALAIAILVALVIVLLLVS